MELDFVISVLDRSVSESMISIYKELDLPLILTFLGRGTATSEHLDLYGLSATEKAVVVTVADRDKLGQLMKNAKRRLFIDIPGNGIMMAIPIKSVSGGRTLAYLTNNAAANGGAPDMNFEHELILVVLNQSYMDDVMNAARSGGASGGTVLHAKGTGSEFTKKFFGVSLANEKEILLIAAKSSKKASIMKAISELAGPQTPAGAISFSLPISAVAGIRDFDAE